MSVRNFIPSWYCCSNWLRFNSRVFLFLKIIGKFLKAIFAIQDVVSQEFISVDPTVTGKTLDERLKDLEGFLIVAVDGGGMDFARTALGKGLFTFTKISI